MAMNKKEMAEFEELKRQLAVAKSFHFTEPVYPDIEPPKGGSGELKTGWTFNAYNSKVEVACTSCVSHATGRIDKTESQRPIHLYSSKTRALKALRAVKEREFANHLLLIDGWIDSVAEEERTRYLP